VREAAYATRDELIAEINFIDDEDKARARGVTGRFAEMEFDFTLQSTAQPKAQTRLQRVRALED
jgi:catechol 1,2-dioxygenase